MTEGHTERLEAALDGKYLIERKLGEGGMATVYLAQDVKHERKVALKILKPELAAVIGAERFLSEIKTTANLQHPHILALFDSGEASGYLYYVMPYIEGETLRDKLDREKQLGVEESVRIARDVADALDYAHRQGVIHRDIKPGNILLHDGRPVVADFGIALAVSAAGGGRMTETGLSLGTPHYMSPEQASADRDLSARSDVYSLGCVLYEMIGGQPPHTGPSAQSILVHILTEEAKPLSKLRHTVPPHVAATVSKAIEKLPADRFETAKQFMEALGDSSFTYQTALRTAAATTVIAPADRSVSRLQRNRQLTALGASLTAVVVLVVLAAWGWLRPEPPLPLMRVSVDFPVDQEITDRGSFDISLDGSLMVYQGPNTAGDGTQLWARRWDALDALPIRDTEDAQLPAVSPNGEEVAFQTDFSGSGSIRVVPIQGGVARTVAPDQVRCCVRWSPDGAWLYFNTAVQGISRVPAAGGPVEVLTEVDSESGDRQHLWIDVLPGGRAAVFRVAGADGERVVAVSIESGEVKELTRGGFPRYSQGYLLFTDPDAGTLFAQPFDADKLELSGTAMPIVEGLRGRTAGWEYFAVSQNGSLVYSTGAGGSGEQLIVIDLDGNEEPLALSRRQIDNVVGWSPDGESIVFASEWQIYTYDIVRGTTPRPLTLEGRNTRPVFSPDGTRVAFSSQRAGTDDFDLFVKDLNVDSPPRSIITLEAGQFVSQWPTDTLIIFERGRGGGARDLWMVDISDPDDPQPRPYRTSEADLRRITVSPDGRHAAYTSNESGVNALYVSSFPDAGARTLVSDRGVVPAWSPDGSTLYAFTGSSSPVLAIRLERDPVPIVLETDTIFSADHVEPFPGSVLNPDGDRFIIARSGAADADGTDEPERLILVTNFAEDLRRRLGQN